MIIYESIEITRYDSINVYRHVVFRYLYLYVYTCILMWNTTGVKKFF